VQDNRVLESEVVLQFRCTTCGSILVQFFQLSVAFQQYRNSQEGDNPVI